MKKIEVVAAVIVDGDKILATQRGYGEFEGLWEFPGGKIELGEVPEAALIRELKEELNADIEVDDFLTTVTYEYPNFHLTMHCYYAHLKNEKIMLLEHSAAKWLAMDEFDTVTWLPADIDVVKAILAR